MGRLRKKYQEEILGNLVKTFGYTSVMQAPKILKITINMGVGEAANDKKVLGNAIADLEKIAGQKPVTTNARKSVASFKIREGWPIGCKVTLRGNRMFEFLDRLISIYFPRIRDFRGFSPKSFDGRGNYTFGIKEQIVCPEIEYDKIDAIRGMDISITTSARNNEEGIALLKAFQFPLRD